ncbi:MAG TPA: helix-turn-helix domain-containing protein [Bacteroidia bacterium]|jgi:transposase|nr:helix-turn-helix domain-containing protein [Bacteroidia bacterium]
MANQEEKWIRTIRGNVRQVVQPLSIIKQAVQEIESGVVSINEAAKKYEVVRTTVRSWMRKYSSWDEEAYIKKKVPKELKREIVSQIEQGLLTKQEAAKKYKIDYSTVWTWVASYSCKPKTNSKQMQELVALEQRSTELIKKENAGLRLSIKELQLKVAGLETMIDLAEDEYNVPIRKKSGTKQ